MPLGTEVGRGPGDVVLELPSQKGGTLFSVHVYCGQTAGWLKTPLGTEVDLGSGHIVLAGDPANSPAKRARSPPRFGPCLLWPRSAVSATTELIFTRTRQEMR